MNVTRRIIVFALIVAIIPLVIASVGSYEVMRRELTARTLSQLQSIAAVQRQRVEGVVHHNLEIVRLVSSRTRLRTALRDYLAEPNPEDIATMRRILLDAQSVTDQLIAISMLDPTGRIVVSTRDDLVGTDMSDQAAFLQGRSADCVDTLVRDETSGDVRLVLSGPLQYDGMFLGVIVIETDQVSLLRPVQDYTGLGRTGETLLASRLPSGDALFLTPLRFDPDAALNRIVSGARTELPIIRASISGEQVSVDTVDYRDEPVLSAGARVSGTNWMIAVKIDRDEAMAPVQRMRVALTTIAVAGLLIMCLIALLASRFVVHAARRQELARIALAESEARFRELAEHVDEVFWVFSVHNGEVLYASPAFEDIWDRPIESLHASDWRWLDAIHPEDRPAAEEAFQDGLKHGGFGFVVRVVQQDSSVRWVRMSGFPVHDDDDGLTRLVATATDITELKQAEQDIRDAHDELEDKVRARTADLRRANDEMSEYIYTVSHDLKSPIVTIQGFASRLQSQLKAGQHDKSQDSSARIVRAATRMKSVIDDLLELSRVGRVNCTPEEIDVADLVQTLCAELAEQIESSGVEVSIVSTLPTIRGDRVRVWQLFQNLLTNAIEYGASEHDGRVEIGARRLDDEVHFFVRDHGPGIDPRHHDRVFELFQRLERGKSGTGVGLSIVRRIAEIHGGRVWIESELGRGATFWVAWPVEGAVVSTYHASTNREAVQ